MQAFSQCTSLHSSQTGGNEEGCSYTHQMVTKSEDWNVMIDISCSSGGGRTSTGDRAGMHIEAQGDCGYADSGPPISPSEIYGPMDYGVGNGTRRVHMDGWTNYYNAGSDNCYAGPHPVDDKYLTDEDCQSAFCCNLEGQCIANGEWYADSCTCVFSPVVLDLD